MADRSSRSDGPSDSAGAADTGRTPGLGEQFGRTRSAFIGLIASHINLAKAEFSEIGGEIKRAVALAGLALYLLLAASFMVIIGLILFIGEVVFGSMGWGVLQGTELLIGATVLVVLAIVDLPWSRAFGALAVALGVGLVVTGVLAVDWSWASSHYNLPSGLLLAVAAGAAVIGLLGAVLGAPFGRGQLTAGLIVGASVGAALGLLASANPGLRVAAAMGVVAMLLFWPIVASVLVYRTGVDTDKLRKRFMPEQTIETTKETIEWVREQMPLGRKS